MATKELWMQRALRRKPGALRRQLGIPKDKNIPATLMRRILDADTGDTVKNPTKIGRSRYEVTKIMQQRVNPVLTARRFRIRKKR
jgi:ribosomal protein S26